MTMEARWTGILLALVMLILNKKEEEEQNAKLPFIYFKLSFFQSCMEVQYPVMSVHCQLVSEPTSSKSNRAKADE